MNSSASPVDIRPDHLEIVQGILRAHLPVGFKAWVFGSRANWTTKDSSDLDLAVEGASSLDHKAMVGLEVAFEESDLPYTVDVVDLNAVSPSFKRLVKDQRVPLPSSDGQANVGADWRQVPVGEVTPLTYGKSLPVDARNLAGRFPVYGSNGIIGWHDAALTDGPTVIIGRKGTVGAVHYSAGPCWPIDTTYFISGVDTELVRFQYYALSTLGLADMNSHSAVPGLNRDDAHALEIPLPPLPEQRAIAHVLGTIDDKIELNRRMNETLEGMARAIFQDWFVNFGPVRAKLEGREPYLPPELWSLFPDRLVDSELGEIPEGWEVKALDEIADYRNGLALQRFRPQGNEGRIPVVKIAQLRSGQADGGEWAKGSITPGCIIDDGDVLFSWSGSLLVRVWCGGRAALNQHLFKVSSSKYPKWFYLNCIESHLLGFQDIAEDKATTMGHIKREHLSDAKCVVPSQSLFSAVDDIFAGLLSRQITANLQSRALAAQRDALLPRLVSGAVGVGIFQYHSLRDSQGGKP